MSNRLIKFLGILGFVILIFLYCSENPLDLQKQTFPAQIANTLRDTTLYPVADTTYLIHKNVDTQFSTRLLLGSLNGLEARPILRFIQLPAFANFLSAKIRLVGDSISTAGNASPFTATLYPAINEWFTNTDEVWNDFRQNIDMNQPYGQVDVTTALHDTLLFELNDDALAKLNFWADTSHLEENYGMLLDFENANFMKYILSRNFSSLVADDPGKPSLLCEYRLPDDTTIYRDTLIAGFDGFIYSGDVPQNPNRNYVSTLVAYNTLLKFDLRGLLSKYSDDIEIVSANLELPVDNANSFRIPQMPANLVIYDLVSEIGERASLEIDSVSARSVSLNQWAADSSYLEVASGNDRRILAASMIRYQLANGEKLPAFLIRFAQESVYYSYIASYKKNEANTALRPKLRISYRIPLSPRL